MRRISRLPLLFLLAFTVTCGNASQPVDAHPPEPLELNNLRAFARLYGVLRFFHPSDEAASLDWNRYAVLGVARVRGARDAGGLEAALESLVVPIAPTVQILRAGETATVTPLPPGDELVAWQHRGPGFDGGQSGYLSKRTSRDAVVDVRGARWTSVTRSIDAVPYRGKPFRLRAYVRAGSGAQVGAWAQVERADGSTGFSDDMRRRMITAAAWTEAIVEGVIDADAMRLLVGAWLTGSGEGWLDDFELTVDGAAVSISNPGFEEGTSGWGGDIGKGIDDGVAYMFEAVAPAHGGAKALHIAQRVSVISEDLFPDRATVGEVAEVDLGGGLTARVPLTLWSKDGHTLPASDSAPIRAALDDLPESPDDADTRIADLVVAWSVFDQFYPYFDVIDADWQAVLDRTLHDGLDDTSTEDHERTLRRLVAALEDGHGHVIVSESDQSSLPLRLAWAEGQLVVLASAAPELARGDVIEAIDGLPVAEFLDAEMALISGSPQWKRVVALDALGTRPMDEPTVLRIARDGGAVDVTVRSGAPPAKVHSQPPVAQLDAGIWYLDLTRATPNDISANIASLAQASGVIIDVRGRPNSPPNALLSHLLTSPDKSTWGHMPRIVRPSLPGAPRPERVWDSRGWGLVPAEPHIAGKIVFLTDGRAISYAESVLGYVEALGIDIVGSPTAGANGDSRSVTLPTRSTVFFTGKKVTRHDGGRSHVVGIRPTIPLEPTIAGIRAGKDELLDRALEVIRTSH